MSGYRWDPVFRVVPVNGAETVYWLSDRLTDAGGHTRVVLRYQESKSDREDINRSLRPVVYGIRPEVTIDCVILSMADQLFLAEIESALLQPRRYSVFLSLDGGVVYRQVALASGTEAAPIAGRTINGARFSLSLRCVNLISERPAMMTDPSLGTELVHDGGCEQWVSASDLQAWSVTPTVMTLAQEASVIAGGTYSAKVTKNNSSFGQLVAKSSAGSLKLKTGEWYRFRASARSTLDMATGMFRAQMYNETRNLFVNSDGKTWTVDFGDLTSASISAAAWAVYEGYFRIPITFRASDVIYARLSGYFTVSQSVYYDNISVYGPVLRPGIATW